MNPVIVRNIKIGEGKPKICVPIVEKTTPQIITKAKEISKCCIHVAEWRADWYEDVKSQEKVIKTAGMLREALGEIPLLFTIRTMQEGGELQISPEKYKEINLAAAGSGFVDLVDVEAFMEEGTVKDLIEKIHKAGAKVIASNHDFEKTPEKEEIVRRLLYMLQSGADIQKIAVMPRCKEDVLSLLSATAEFSEKHKDCPIVTMSMGAEGMVSRIVGEVFGSALTFGSVGKTSAPGQIAADKLAGALDMVHTCCVPH